MILFINEDFDSERCIKNEKEAVLWLIKIKKREM